MKRAHALLILFLFACIPAAHAAEVHILSAGAAQPGLIAAIAAFRERTGHEGKLEFAIASELRRRIGGGEVVDVLVAPNAVAEALTSANRVAAADQVYLGRVGAGVVIRNGGPVPDISSAAALRQALLDADSVVYNRASSGTYIESMLRKLNLYERLEPKLTRYSDGTAVMRHLMEGKGREFGFGGITDILLYRDKGLTLVGPLPEELQNYTPYTAAVVTSAANPAAALAFVRFLASAEGKQLFVNNGIR